MDRLAAAICQAGMEADRLNCGDGLVLGLGIGAAAAAAAAGACGVSCSTDGAGTPLVGTAVAGDDVSTGREAVGSGAGVAAGFARAGDAAALGPPRRLPSKVFKLFNSVPSSFNRLSLPSRAPSKALGMASFSDRISSLIRRVSSSLRREAVFKSATRLSTSRSAESNRSVRVSSADFRAAVSVESCSIRVNALENCSSMFSLSCSSCGGVGGAIRGAT